VEPAVLVALQHDVSNCVLVGDPRQLPATVHLDEQSLAGKLYERSLFERMEQVLSLTT